MAKIIQNERTAGIAELEAVFAEFVEELRCWRDMLEVYRETVADAARYIAQGLADISTLPATQPRAYDLAYTLGRMAGVSPEIEDLLPHASSNGHEESV